MTQTASKRSGICDQPSLPKAVTAVLTAISGTRHEPAALASVSGTSHASVSGTRYAGIHNADPHEPSNSDMMQERSTTAVEDYV